MRDDAQSFGFELENFSEFEKKFDGLLSINPKEFFNDALKWAGKRLTLEMKAETPISKRGVRSREYPSRTHARGTLRRSIGYKIGGEEIPTVWVSLRRYENKKADAWYSHIVVGGHEYGTVKVAPNPIVRRTMDKVLPTIQGEMRTRMQKKLTALLK